MYPSPIPSPLTQRPEPREDPLTLTPLHPYPNRNVTTQPAALPLPGTRAFLSKVGSKHPDIPTCVVSGVGPPRPTLNLGSFIYLPSLSPHPSILNSSSPSPPPPPPPSLSLPLARRPLSTRPHRANHCGKRPATQVYISRAGPFSCSSSFTSRRPHLVSFTGASQSSARTVSLHAPPALVHVYNSSRGHDHGHDQLHTATGQSERIATTETITISGERRFSSRRRIRNLPPPPQLVIHCPTLWWWQGI